MTNETAFPASPLEQLRFAQLDLHLGRLTAQQALDLAFELIEGPAGELGELKQKVSQLERDVEYAEGEQEDAESREETYKDALELVVESIRSADMNNVPIGDLVSLVQRLDPNKHTVGSIEEEVKRINKWNALAVKTKGKKRHG